MKTVSEFAKEKNISVQTVYRHLKAATHDKNDSVKHNVKECLTQQQGRITYITPKGEEYLTGCLTGVKRVLNTVKEDIKPETAPENEYLAQQVTLLQEELNKEREHSRQQAIRLADLAEQLAGLSRNNQVLLGIEQKKIEQIEIKKPFWQRFFGG